MIERLMIHEDVCNLLIKHFENFPLDAAIVEALSNPTRSRIKPECKYVFIEIKSVLVLDPIISLLEQAYLKTMEGGDK